MNHLDPLSQKGPLPSSLGPPVIPHTGDPASTPHYAFAKQENLHQTKPSTASRYLFPSPRPSAIPQENRNFVLNPPVSYSHLVPSSGPAGIPPSTSYNQLISNYITPQSFNRHYLPQYPPASIQGSGFMPATSSFTVAAQGGGLWAGRSCDVLGKEKNLTLGAPPSCASLVNQVADGKLESKGQRQDQECEKKMSDERLKNNGTIEFEGSCYRCGEKYHKAGDCPQKKKKMLDEQLKNDSAIEGTCFHCGEKDHKVRDCPLKKKKMSDELPKNNDSIEFEGSCFRCGEKYHKAEDCPKKKKKMLDEQLENDNTIEAGDCPLKKKKVSDEKPKGAATFRGSCSRCGEKYHKAANCPQKKKKMSDEQPKEDITFRGSCSRCGEKYHKAADCPQKKKKKMSDEQPKDDTFTGACYCCRERHHKAMDCPQKMQMTDEQAKNSKKKMSDEQPKDDTFKGSCYLCRGRYHKAEDCPQKMQMTDEQARNNNNNDNTIEILCFSCGEKDHKANNCPQKKKISDEQLKKNGNSDSQKALGHLGPVRQRGQPQHFTLPTHGKSLMGIILHELCSMRFDGEGSVCEYILKMEDLVRRLRELKMEIRDDFLVHMVLNSLPQAFTSVKLEYYSTADTWNVNELIAHCVHQEAKA